MHLVHNCFVLEFTAFPFMCFLEEKHLESLAPVPYFSWQSHKVCVSNNQCYILDSIAVCTCVYKRCSMCYAFSSPQNFCIWNIMPSTSNT